MRLTGESGFFWNPCFVFGDWALELQIEFFLPKDQININPVDIHIRWTGDHVGCGFLSYMPIWILSIELYNIHHADEEEDE